LGHILYIHLFFFWSGFFLILDSISLHGQIIDICKFSFNCLVLFLYNNSSFLTLPLPVFSLWCSFELLWILMLILSENTDSAYILSFIFVWK
jgi:hypothetical protein